MSHMPTSAATACTFPTATTAEEPDYDAFNSIWTGPCSGFGKYLRYYFLIGRTAAAELIDDHVLTS